MLKRTSDHFQIFT